MLQEALAGPAHLPKTRKQIMEAVNGWRDVKTKFSTEEDKKGAQESHEFSVETVYNDCPANAHKH
jgi:hypothetical protein